MAITNFGDLNCTSQTVTLCEQCRQRQATEIWSEGALAYVHGLYVNWCKPCVLTAQLAHARKVAASIPDLERQLTAHAPQEPT